MENKPLVSILIPSYNHESYIDDCMMSLVEQTYNEIELLVIDDNSDDKTFKRILNWQQRLKKKFRTVRIERNDVNLGVTKTLNKMLDSCKGKYIKTMASDDFLLVDAIENLVNYYEKNQELGLILANGICGNKDTHYPLQTQQDFKTYYQKEPDFSGNLVEKLYEDNFIFAPGTMFSRDTYFKIGKFDEKIWIEDWDYYLRIASNMSIGYLDKVVVMYRYTDTSLTQSTSIENRLRMRKSELQILDKHKTLVCEDISRKLINSRCNIIFKEAFDMRSKEYVEDILMYMKSHNIQLKGNNIFLSILYRSHLFDGLFYNKAEW